MYRNSETDRSRARVGGEVGGGDGGGGGGGRAAARAFTLIEMRDLLEEYEEALRDANKARTTVATYIQMPERFLNWIEGRYVPRRHVDPPDPDMPQVPRDNRGSRYEALRDHLQRRSEVRVTMTFFQIERLLGRRLPRSARRYASWWANDRSGNHAQCRAWTDAGRRTSNLSFGLGSVDFILKGRNLRGTWAEPTG